MQTPSTTTNKIYNVGGALYFNGAAVGGGGSGDITAVSAGTNLNGGGTSGAVTLNLDTALTGLTSIALSGNMTVTGTVDGRDISVDGSKLDGIESGATADQTQTQINALGITATGLSGTPNITVATITSGDINSSGAVTASGNVTAFSDKRLKTNIETLNPKLALKMRGVSFIKDGTNSSGVIAQEIEEIAPELVLTANDEMGTKSVAYGNLVGYLIETVKDQQKQIDELKQRISA